VGISAGLFNTLFLCFLAISVSIFNVFKYYFYTGNNIWFINRSYVAILWCYYHLSKDGCLCIRIMCMMLCSNHFRSVDLCSFFVSQEIIAFTNIDKISS